jgi:hypothetical protein
MDELDGVLRRQLPGEFLGFSTHFPDSDGEGSRIAKRWDGGSIDHYVELSTISRFLSQYVGIRSVDELSEGDWLSLPSQKLLTLSTGPIFHDGVALADLQDQLRFYPDNIWMYLMAAQWSRLDQEEPFIGRTGMVGDEIGSGMVAARLVHHAIRLAFLIERRYAPYSKWIGTAFGNLACADQLVPLVSEVLNASEWTERESAFNRVAVHLGERHNDLGITEHVDPSPRLFHSRPIQVLGCDRFASALKRASEKSRSSNLWTSRPIGGVDTFSDSTDLLEDTTRRSAVANLITK